MKTISFILSGIFVLLSFNIKAQAVQHRQVAKFTGVSLETFADVYITPGDQTSVTVKADDQVIDQVITEVRNGVLHIRTEGRIRTVKIMNVYVTLNKLDMLKVSGSGDVSCSGAIWANGLKIKVAGSGDIESDIDNIKNVEVSISGSGDVSLQRVGGDFSASISGSGDLEVDHMLAEKCVISIAGSGDVELGGACVDLTAKLMGSGNIDAGNLKAVHVSIDISGSGDGTVLAANSISAVINGSGDLVYYGHPDKTSIVSDGSGDVYRR